MTTKHILKTLLLITFFTVSNNTLSAQISIIAHRGASAYEPENSLAAFKKAFELNADAIELDIWKTTDDSLIVNHDRSTLRTSNGDLVIPQSSAAQIRELRLKNGEKIPFLQEVLEILPKGKKVVIEIKCGNEPGKAGDVVPQLKQIIGKRINDIIIISFHAEALAKVKQEFPSVKCYWLSSKKQKAIETCQQYKFDGLDINQSILSDSLAQACKANKLDLLVWTVDSPLKALNARLNNKVCGITTNKPDMIRDILAKNNYSTTYYEQKRSIYEMLPDTKNEIIFLGNSITDVGEWAEFFQNNKVKNRGISGDITLGVLARLDEVTRSKPAKVFLLIGINDISKENPDSIILHNYRLILDKLQKDSPQTKVYVQSIFPTNGQFTQFARHQNKTEHILYLNQQLKALCAERKLTYIDVYSVLSDGNNQLKTTYTNDGLHLLAEGYKVWIELLKPYMK